ncbi:MAG TPA: carboxypeptidase-like regulatory domain-containing protein [Actinomycetota bacterium]|nr:carboxypeptidase-like regulatory domain-containing protein [Actinomycetota bacterium]
MDTFAAFRRAGTSLGSVADPVAAFARVFDAREALLRSALRLRDAFRDGRVRTSTHTQTTCLDLAGVPSLHTARCTLSIDVGGNDRYRNNAGGTSGGAAAAIDLGGSDSYASTLNIGSNGGGSFGAGFLFDAAGNDSYVGGNQASNGGGYLLGAGFLLDAGGSDRYTGRACTNGGACAFASGTLLDLGTRNDAYSAGGGAVNGGVLAVAHGMLLDAGGTDTYSEGAPCYGSGVDRTVVPKGDGVGAQLDSTNPRGRTCIEPPPPPPPATIGMGAIWGRVSAYGTGQGITGATVDCRRAGTGVTTVDGRYSIPAAPGGSFRCTATASGFRPQSRDVTVRPGYTTIANFALRR